MSAVKTGGRRLRICYVGHSDAHFLPPYVDWFAGRGHEVHLVTLHADVIPSAIMHRVIDGPFDPLRDKMTYLRAGRRVVRAVRDIGADLVHAHFLTSNAVLAALSGCRPLIVSARGTDVYGSRSNLVKRALARFAMRRADLVNVVSADLERIVLGWGLPPRKVLRLSQGIEVERFASARIARAPGPPRLVCTRRLSRLYNGARIVAALDLLVRRGVDFTCTFAAGGPEQPALEREVARGGLAGRVRFAGGYAQSEAPALLAAHDVYVSAAAWDGTSPALLEALAAGLFPVVSDTAANREWLTGEGDGLLFDGSSAEALADCLQRACTDAALRETAAGLNLTRVAAHGDRAKNLTRLEQVYLALVGAASAGPAASETT